MAAEHMTELEKQQQEPGRMNGPEPGSRINQILCVKLVADLSPLDLAKSSSVNNIQYKESNIFTGHSQTQCNKTQERGQRAEPVKKCDLNKRRPVFGSWGSHEFR